MVNQGGKKFYPIEEVNEILLELKKINLNWMAEEINEIIQNGKIEEKNTDVNYKKKVISELIPFSDKEQLNITLDVLYTYFIELPDIWNNSIKKFKEEFGQGEINILNPINDEVMIPFDPNYEQKKFIFKDLINKAKKEITGNFDDEKFT